MLYLEKFTDFTASAPVIYVNHASRVFIVDSVAYGFDMQPLGVVNGLNESLSPADLWKTVKKGAVTGFNLVKDSMWSTVVPPTNANITTADGMLEWGHYILGLGSLILGLTGIGEAVSIAVDMIDGTIHFVEGIVKKVKLKVETFEPYTHIISGGIAIGGALMGGRAVSGPILKAIKEDAKVLAQKVSIKAITKEAAVKTLLGQNNAMKTFQGFLEALQNQTMQAKVEAAFATFLLFIKEIPVLNTAVQFVNKFVKNVIFWITEGAKWVAEKFNNMLNPQAAVKAKPKPAAAKPGATTTPKQAQQQQQQQPTKPGMAKKLAKK